MAENNPPNQRQRRIRERRGAFIHCVCRRCVNHRTQPHGDFLSQTYSSHCPCWSCRKERREQKRLQRRSRAIEQNIQYDEGYDTASESDSEQHADENGNGGGGEMARGQSGHVVEETTPNAAARLIQRLGGPNFIRNDDGRNVTNEQYNDELATMIARVICEHCK